MHGESPTDDPLNGLELSRRELIRRIVVGSAFAVPVIASFDMSSLGVSSAYANSPNQHGPLSFSSANATTFTVGQAGSFTVTTAGPGPVTVSEAGSLPSGVSFTPLANDDSNQNNAVISGTPAAGTGGSYSLSFTASDGNIYPNAVQAFMLTIDEPPAFTSATAATLSTAAASSFAITTVGYPAATIALSGALPAGVFFTANPSTGAAVLSGQPAAPGVYPVTLSASNGVSPAATQTLTLTVDRPPAFTSAATATFSSAEPSSFEITTVGSPPAMISLAGSLPAGVTFTADAATGTALLSGQPKTAKAGTYPLTLTAANGVSPAASQTLVLTVTAAKKPREKTPKNTFTVSHITIDGAEAVFKVKVPGPGTITAVVSAPRAGFAAATAASKQPKRLAVARARVKTKRAGTVKVKAKPNSTGRRLVRSHKRGVTLWLTITFTPTGGKPHSEVIKHLHLR